MICMGVFQNGSILWCCVLMELGVTGKKVESYQGIRW